MNTIPGLLMITWNRREYFERTIKNVLADPSEFRLYIWDNGSQDGVRDIIDGIRDERIARRYFSKENVGQFNPWHWFLDACSEEIAGKLDDDIIGEHGWMARFAEMVANCETFGVLGAWVFLPSEWDELAARHKIVTLGRYSLFQNVWVPGGIFLGRRQVLSRFASKDPRRLGVPLRQDLLTQSGFVNGFPLPISFAEHLDDPRSPHCRMNRPGGWDQFAAYTARMRKFSGPEEYGRWIARDARMILETPVSVQMRAELPTPMDRVISYGRRGWNKIKKKVKIGSLSCLS